MEEDFREEGEVGNLVYDLAIVWLSYLSRYPGWVLGGRAVAEVP